MLFRNQDRFNTDQCGWVNANKTILLPAIREYLPTDSHHPGDRLRQACTRNVYRAFCLNHVEDFVHRISMAEDKKPVLRVTVFTDYI